MAASEEMKIVLQVGTELRVSNKGEVVVSNPELELAREDRAADAVLLYRFDANRGEHIFAWPRRSRPPAHESASRQRLIALNETRISYSTLARSKSPYSQASPRAQTR